MNEGVGILATILAIGIVGIFLLIHYTIIGIIMIIVAICMFVINKNKQNNIEEKQEEIIKDKWDIAGKYRETLASGEKRKKFKTDDGVEIIIEIEDNDDDDDDDDEDDDEDD